MDGQKNVRIDSLSKLTKIEDLRQKLVMHFNAEPERQRLFFRGKQVIYFVSSTLYYFLMDIKLIKQFVTYPVARRRAYTIRL